MVTKIVNVDIDMYNNSVLNFRPEAVTELPPTTVEGRMVYLIPKRQLYVYTDGVWITTGERNPTKVSELINDSHYLTSADVNLDEYYTKTETDDLIAGIANLEFKVVDALPETGESNYIYLIPSETSKAKNAKDEYIWVEGAWEMIGTTQFELRFTQGADGIEINGHDLQKATEAQDGLMSKDQVIELHGKQDKLIAGANIVIEGNIISAIGGSGGSSGIRPTVVAKFGGQGGTSFNINHGLGTYNLLYQIRTVSVPVRYIQADVSAPDEDTLTVNLANDLNSELSISILACDKITVPVSENVIEKPVETESTVWTYINDTGKPMYVQLFDSSGNEIRGDVTQESTEAFSSVVASLSAPSTGTMLVKSADIMVTFNQRTSVEIDVTEYGYTTEDMFLVQVYVDGTGQSMPDIIQDAGTGIISVDLGDEAKTGSITLVQATQKYRIENETDVVYTHNLGRAVGVQLYLDGTGQAMVDIVCATVDTVEVSANIPITGTLLVL